MTVSTAIGVDAIPNHLTTIRRVVTEINGNGFALAIRNLLAQGHAAFQQESALFSEDSDFLPSPSSWRAAVLALQ